MKTWQISVPDKQKAAELSDQFGFPPFLSLLLVTRGLRDPDAIQRFRAASDWSDPMLLPDMAAAAARVQRAIDEFEPILIFGDYDADGVTATAILYSYLETCGANVRYRIPTRAEGYGLNRAAVEQAAADGIRLIITVDNGVSAAEEVALAASLGIDTVVTDHHKVPEKLPQAVAVVDAHRADSNVPYADYCGAGVALKLVAALEQTGDEMPADLLEHFGDLAAIGTVADVVPLTGENRALVRAGLRQLAQTDRMGLRRLMDAASITDTQLTAQRLAFTLIPRINAMGRMGNSAQTVQLFLTDYDEEAQDIAAQLAQANEERQRLESEILRSAEEFLHVHPRSQLERVLVVWGADWHPGVIGIVAARLVEKYGKPTIVIGVHDGMATGSCRSIEGFSIIEALTACAPYLTRFGGHMQAAGFAMEEARMAEFANAVNQYAAALPEMPLPTLKIDCKLNPAGLSVELVNELREMEPFGAENPSPVFAIMGMELIQITPVGGNRHLRLNLARGDARMTAMLFRTAAEEFPYRVGDRLDLAVTLDVSTYNGREEVSVVIRDYRPEDYDAAPLLRQKQRYEAFARGELSADDAALLRPTREQIAAVYRLFRAEEGQPRTMAYFCYRLRDAQIGYDRLTIALVALRQLGLIRVTRSADTLTVWVLPAEKKVQLDAAPILAKFKEKAVS